MKEVTIYTDGACSGNPGEGGWCAILMYKQREKVVSGYNKYTTNNRMELFAVIQGLNQLKEPCIVNLYSDSAYVVNAITQGWAGRLAKKNVENRQRRSQKHRPLENSANQARTARREIYQSQGARRQRVQQPLR